MNVVISPAQKIVIVFEGVEYPCTKPKLGAVMDLEAGLEAAKSEGRGGTQLLMQHLVLCGLPENVVKQLDVDQLEAVAGVLTPAKKN